MMQLGNPRGNPGRPAYKPTPRNLRYFSNTPYARRAINAIKNSIAQLDWEIVARPGAEISDEVRRQMDITQNCLENPNDDDSFSQLMEQVVEDICCGAGCVEQQIGGDALRPLFLWPVDGLSIQIYPLWEHDRSSPRYVQMLGYGSASGSTPVAEFYNEELVYIRPNPTTATPFGIGPLEIAFMSISRMLGVQDYAGKVSSNSNPSIFLWLGDVTDDELREMRGYWRNDIEGRGRMPIGGGGEVKPEAVRLYPEGDNALYLKYQEVLRREIAIGFDLSPQNLGVEHDINRNTAEVAEDRDMSQVIGPFGRKIARQFSRETIQGRLGFSSLEFRFKGLDRDDELEAATVFEKEYKNNATTPNEYRARRGQPRLDNTWADRTFADVQIAMEAARGSKVVDDPQLAVNQDASPEPQAPDRVDTSLPGRTTSPSGSRPFMRRNGSGRNLTKKP